MFNLLWILYCLSFVCSFNNITVSTTNINIQIGNFKRGTPERRNLHLFVKKFKSNRSIISHSNHVKVGNTNTVWAVPKIIGGWIAHPGEVPYLVSLKKYRKREWQSFCGGSIITDNHILTAAHCIASHREMSLCLLRLGVKNLPMIEDFSRIYVVAGCLINKVSYVPKSGDFGQWRKIKKISVPDDYDFPLRDISIFTLKHPFILNQFVTPIPLASQDVDYSDCVITGFGNTYYHSNTPVFSEYLMHSKVVVMPKSSCNDVVKGETRSFVCTDDTYKTASAVGDSGGPLVCRKPSDPNDQGFGVLVGVVCAGIKTGNISVYSKVVAHRKFIVAGLASHLQCSALLILFNVFLLIV